MTRSRACVADGDVRKHAPVGQSVAPKSVEMVCRSSHPLAMQTPTEPTGPVPALITSAGGKIPHGEWARAVERGSPAPRAPFRWVFRRTVVLTLRVRGA